MKKINFNTKNGVRFIAALLGDGCLDKRLRIFYANSNPDLINGFIKDVKTIFGNNVIYHIREKSNNPKLKLVELPSRYGKIVVKIGLKGGSKIENNTRIPCYIFNLSKRKRIEFLSQIIDDEGIISFPSRHIAIHMATENKNKPNLVLDIKELLKSVGIESSIYKEKEYTSLKGPNRKMWKIEIHSFKQLEEIYRNFSLRHKEKLQRLKILIDSKKQIQYPKKKFKEIITKSMKKIEVEKGYFTSKDLSSDINRSLGHSRNVTRKFFKQGLIKKVKSYKSGNIHSFAKYKVSK